MNDGVRSFQGGVDGVPLPADIWTEVTEYLKPSHILSLGQTCKALGATLSTKAIWVRILRAVCRRHGLFLSTYPFDKMDVPQLQRAAMGPELYLHKINRDGVLPRDLESAQPLPLAVSPPHEWKRVAGHLVPGGRFLVTIPTLATTQVVGPITVSVWDLGVPGARPRPSPLKMGSHTFQESSRGVTDLVGCIVDGSCLRIPFRSERQHLETSFQVCTITLNEKGPVFEETASIRLYGRLWYRNYVFTPERMILLRRHSGPDAFLLWNYTSNHYATWFPGIVLEHPVEPLMCFERYLVYSCSTLQSLVLWDLSLLVTQLQPVPVPPTPVGVPSDQTAVLTLKGLVIPSPWASPIANQEQFDLLEGLSPSSFPGELVVGTASVLESVTYRWYGVNIAEALLAEPQPGLTGPSTSDPSQHSQGPPIADANNPFVLFEAPQPPPSPYRLLAESQFPEWAAPKTPNFNSATGIFFPSDGVCDILDCATGTRGGFCLFSPLSSDEVDRAQLKIAPLQDGAHYFITSMCKASGRAISLRFTNEEEDQPYIRLLEFI